MKRVCTGVIAVLLCLAIMVPASVYANSAQTIWSGVTSSGVIVEDENCPLIVEKEVLTFDVPEFPSNYYRSIEEFVQYPAAVTAEYTFYNPSDYTVTATLAFPFGNMPDYGIILDEDGETWSHQTAAHTNQYGVKVNGEAIRSTLRHTYSDPYDDFDLEKDLPKLRDGFAEDEFFSPDMTVTQYTYQISGLSADEGYAVLSLTADESIRRIYPDEFNGFRWEGDQIRFGCWVKNGVSLIVTVVGALLEDGLDWSVYESGMEEKKIEGDISLTGTDTMTFLEFALTEYEQGSGILESDWYNAFVDELNHNRYMESDMELSYSLMRWYEYEITLEPGQRITNTVTAPIYPRINGQYEPPVYDYSYLLSPAQTWSEFGSLEIIINTPYYMISSNQQKLEKTEAGYSVSLDGLPEGELTFSLSSAEKPEKEMPDIGSYLLLFLLYFAVLAIPLILLVFLGVWLVRVVGKHIKKKEKS